MTNLTEVKEKKKRQINPDRIVLEVESVALAKRINDQINDVFGGVIKLTHKEIANFLLQQRSELLSQSELKAIKDKHFDDVRAAQWAVQKLKAAKDSGQELTLGDVLSMIQSPTLKDKRTHRTLKVTKKKEVVALPHETNILAPDTANTRSKTDLNGVS